MPSQDPSKNGVFIHKGWSHHNGASDWIYRMHCLATSTHVSVVLKAVTQYLHWVYHSCKQTHPNCIHNECSPIYVKCPNTESMYTHKQCVDAAFIVTGNSSCLKAIFGDMDTTMNALIVRL